ncbi:sugar ABC transporter substrate-binding protein [Lentzea sp. DG1S-22]|uniref:sugar ABC transporter substrate-binding protein n=1 Tax=Lentzea sp. DG1S-22 TaxID=3108822 RepID=UPI002E7712C3|nr:sugar ABC transporter substrate-binding protein [Lentzea sp. DG1S-22]WVH84274.1 sugar ABC transporter substrate-binding protein [Lentzea sp. DG1S-22]
MTAAVATAVVLLAACGGDPAGGAGNADQATLTFVNAQDPGTFDEVIAGFQQANPGIKVEQQVLPFDDLNSAVQSRLGSKDASIDLFDVDEPRLASFAARGFLLDLSDLRRQAGDAIDPEVLDATSYDGKQYAMPRWTSTQLLFYNKAVLAKAGVAAPSSDPAAPATWEDLTAAGKKAQSAGAEWGLVFDQVDRYYQLQPLPESLGAGPGLSGPGLLTPAITNEGWTKAAGWYASIFRDGVAPRGVAVEQTPGLFTAGDTAFFAGGPWNADIFDKVADLDYGIAPFPVFAGGKPASSTGSWATGVSPFSKNQAAAKKFIAYMTTDPTGALQAQSRNIPVQREAYQQYLKQLRDKGGRSVDLAAVVEHELATNAVSRPVTTGYVDFETVMNKVFADIRNGSEPARRLDEAAQELDRVLAKYRNR